MEKKNRVNTSVVHRVLYLSNFIRSKGYREVLVLAKLEKERVMSGGDKKLHFEFAGKFFSEEERQYFFKYIEDNELNDFITYNGIVGGDTKRQLLNKCDIFILLTTYPNEGQPISILEAMGNGMFVVTTNHAGIPDVVINRMNGIVMDKNNIDIQFCYETLLKIPKSEFIDVMNRNREKIVSDYNQNKYINNLDAVFDAL